MTIVPQFIAKQIQEAAIYGVPIFALGNVTVNLPHGGHTTVLNLAMNELNGRNKLFKYIKAVPGLLVDGDTLQAMVSVSVRSYQASHPVRTGIQARSFHIIENAELREELVPTLVWSVDHPLSKAISGLRLS